MLSTPAFAVDEIKTIQTTVVKTSTAGGTTTAADVLIDAGGGINLKTTDPLITIDSNNTVTNNGTLTGSGESNAVAVLFDTTSKNLTGAYTQTGTIDLSGSGTGKIGFHMTGTNSFTGNIAIGAATVGSVAIVGDQSTGILFDSGTTLNGDLTLGGTFTLSPTSANSTTSTGVEIASLAGTIKGSVIVAPGSTYSATGNGAQGFVITGAIKAASATDIGSFVNNGQIGVAGIALRSPNVKNVNSGSALVIQNGIAGGILNNGPNSGSDTTVAGVIAANGATSTAPTIKIAPLTTSVGTNMVIGQDTLDAVNGAYSFINRGTISALGENPNDEAHTIRIGGLDQNTYVKFTGGFLTSGAVTAQAVGATQGSSSSGVVATAFEIDNFVDIPKIVVSSQAAGAASAGTIAASISGTVGGTARAVWIQGVPVSGVGGAKIPEIDIDTGASIAATAAVTDPSLANVQLTAIAIEDDSGSLTKINNNGTISAVASTLTNGNTAKTVAVNVAANSTGVTFNDSGNVIGDVLFGSGADTFNIQGPSSTAIAQVGGGKIDFGTSGTGVDTLHVGQFSNVAGTITSEGDLDIAVDQHATLFVQNVVTTPNTALLVRDLIVMGGTPSSAGTLDLTVSQGAGTNAVIQASHAVTLGSGTNLSVAFGSLLTGSGGTFNLISTPLGGLSIDTADLARYNASVGSDATRPFLFKDAAVLLTHTAANDFLQIHVDVKTATDLGLTGYAKAMFPLANAAVANDPQLGAALITGVNSPAQAQAAYDAFAPDVSGGERAIAISLTDQATGAVSARLRNLRLFAKEPGELTLWGNEYGQYMSTHGGTVPVKAGVINSGPVDGFKDHGFGFSLGLDEGSPGGWYGAAFSFYSGDVAALGDRNDKTNSLWYMLTGYSTWRGRALFFDSQVNIGYANMKGKRILSLDIPIPGSPNSATFTREADNKHAGEFASLGMTMGATMKYGPITAIPQISIDGLTMREEGYTESNGGVGMNLTVKPYYANSLRVFLGNEFRTSVSVGDFFLQPAARLGYRFDLLADPEKLKAAFADTNPNLSGDQNGNEFTLQGPDPSRGNVVLGASLNATTESWTIGLNYDFVRGSHNATEQVGTFTLLGRI
ncbi:MAG TPA: autotransporter outer membrane beta-barrel domain-containing protein [Rhizomicrobium sp.]